MEGASLLYLQSKCIDTGNKMATADFELLFFDFEPKNKKMLHEKRAGSAITQLRIVVESVNSTFFIE
jgi:hypothetical protein